MLALVIGANTTVFSVVNAVVLEPLPYNQPQRLVRLSETSVRSGVAEMPVSVPNFSDWQHGSNRQTMGTYDGGPCLSNRKNSSEESLLPVWIHRSAHLVEEDYTGIPRHSPCQRDAVPLSTG